MNQDFDKQFIFVVSDTMISTMSEDWIKKGMTACENEAFEEGLNCFNQALKTSPKNHVALYQRAKVYSKLNNLHMALNDFQQLILIQPDNAHYLGEYAVALHLNEQNTEAALQFERALMLEPENPYRYASRAFFKDRTGDHMGAIADYEKTLELDPEDAIALNNKGLIEEKLGYMHKAKESFDQSNKLVNYEPKFSDQQASHSQKATQNHSEKMTKTNIITPTFWSVFRSVFTRDGFKDFISFFRNKF